MADGRILKPDKDFTKEVDSQIPEAQDLAKVTFTFLPLLTVLTAPISEKCSSSYRKAWCARKIHATGSFLWILLLSASWVPELISPGL